MHLRAFRSYVLPLTVCLAVSLIVQGVPSLHALFRDGANGFYLALVLACATGYGIRLVVPNTATVPPLVWAMVCGVVLHPLLSALTASQGSFIAIMQLLAAFVLFAGGVRVPIGAFKRYAVPVATFTTIGTMCAAFAFAVLCAMLLYAVGIVVPALSLVVLALLLTSTDLVAFPLALEQLRFRNPLLRDLMRLEGAVSGVVGTVAARFFLAVALTAGASVATTVVDSFFVLGTRSVLERLALEVLWGVGVGIVGAWILRTWGASVRAVHWSDSVLFFIVPLFCFALGSLVGGAGFLAAFVAGLLYDSASDARAAEQSVARTVDHVIAPTVFVLFGALASGGMGDPVSLLLTAAVGIVVGTLLMFVVRPLVVYVSLLPLVHTKQAGLSWREALFLSLARETGATQVALLTLAGAAGLVAAPTLLAIGMWAIILTYSIEAPLIPLLARLLDLER